MKILGEEKWKRFGALNDLQKNAVYLIIGEIVNSEKDLEPDYIQSIDLGFILNDDQKEIVKEIISISVEAFRNVMSNE